MRFNLKTKLILTHLFLFFIALLLLMAFTLKIEQDSQKEHQKLARQNRFLKIKGQVDRWYRVDSQSLSTSKRKQKLKELLNQASIFDYIIFNKQADTYIKQGDISLPENFHSQAQDKSGSMFWQSIQQDLEQRHFSYNSDNMPQRLFLSLPTPAQKKDLVLMTGLSDLFFKELHRETQVENIQTLLLLGTLLLLLLFTSSYLILHFLFLRPMNLMREGIIDFLQGVFTSPIPHISQDEMGELAGNINELGDQLAQHQEKNRYLSHDLSQLEHNHEIETHLLNYIYSRRQQRLQKQNLWSMAVQQKKEGSITGDLFGAYHIPGSNKILFYLLDSSGHSATTTLLSYAAGLALEELSLEYSEPKEMLPKLNDQIYHWLDGSGQHVKAFLLLWNSANGNALYASAGSQPAYLIQKRSAGITYEILEANGFNLGSMARPPIDFEQKSILLQSQDLLLLHSNGLVDVSLDQGEKLSKLIAQELLSLPNEELFAGDSLEDWSKQAFDRLQSKFSSDYNKNKDKTLIAVQLPEHNHLQEDSHLAPESTTTEQGQDLWQEGQTDDPNIFLNDEQDFLEDDLELEIVDLEEDEDSFDLTDEEETEEHEDLLDDSQELEQLNQELDAYDIEAMEELDLDFDFEKDDLEGEEPGDSEPKKEQRSANLQQAINFYQKKQFSQALPLLEQELQQDPDSLEAQTFYSDTLFHLDRNEEALDSYQRVLDQAPHDPDTQFKIGLIHYRQGNLQASAQMMEQAIEQKTSYGDAWLYAGVSYANQGKYDEALRILQQATEQGVYTEEVQTLINKIENLKASA